MVLVTKQKRLGGCQGGCRRVHTQAQKLRMQQFFGVWTLGLNLYILKKLFIDFPHKQVKKCLQGGGILLPQPTHYEF